MRKITKDLRTMNRQQGIRVQECW